jgi:hypothetical protein
MSYELKKDKSGQFIFNLKARNGRIILSSESYPAKASALSGIDSVRKNGPSAASFESRTSTKGQPYFVLKAANGQIIGRSEMYSSKAAKDRGIPSVQKNCASPVVHDKTTG